MKTFRKELIISLILIILLVLILNPFRFWMPDMLHMVVLALLVVFFAILASFILKERTTDEREVAHKMFAGRIAFLMGSSVLMLGIVIQVFRDNIDPWLITTLVFMILGKIGALLYSDKNQ